MSLDHTATSTPDGEGRDVSKVVEWNEGLIDGNFSAHFEEFRLALSLSREGLAVRWDGNLLSLLKSLESHTVTFQNIPNLLPFLLLHFTGP